MTTVSVVIPTYNRADLIGEAIESVLGQTFQDFELIVVDDGSTDGTEAVVDSYADARIRFQKQGNEGVSAARNAGIRASIGELVAFLDSDDLFLPNRLSSQVEKFSDHPAPDLVYGRYLLAAGADAQTRLSGVCYPELGLEQLLMGPVFHWSTTLVRHAALMRVDGFDPRFRIGEEWELTLRLALSGCRMACVVEPVAVVRYQPGSLTRELYQNEKGGADVLEKIFSDPGLPRDLLALREDAHAARLLRFAVSEYLGPEPGRGAELLLSGLKLIDPGLDLKPEIVDPQLRKFVSFLTSVSPEDPEALLQRVSGLLPGSERFRERLAQQLRRLYLVEAAFKAHNGGRYRESRKYAIRALVRYPRNLRNRGLILLLLGLLPGERIMSKRDR